MRTATALLVMLVIPAALGADESSEPLWLPGIFGDHMVLQSGLPIPVWGKAAPGQSVTVTLGELPPQSATADKNGTWAVEIPPQRPSADPIVLTVQAGQKTKRYKDVLIGEVWLASGQSNMAWTVANSNNAKAEIASANYPQIRLYTVPHRTTLQPMDDVNGRWVTCSPGTVRNFSAVAYYFGRQLHRDLNVPVGLIHSSWGGTPAEAWTSGPQLKKYKLLRHYWQRLQKILASKPDTVTPQMMADYKAKLRQWKKNQNIKDPGNRGFQQGWAGETVDENDWKTMNLPGLWERAKDPLTINGAVWFRKEVYLPQSWAGKDLTLQLGRIDDFDVTYFNGTPVGEHPWGDGDAYATPRAYTVPGKLVRQGQNTIAVRVFDWKGGGGVVGPQLSLRPADQSAPPMSLNGPWQYRVEYAVAQVSRPSDPRKIKPNTPSVLFNGMIAPLIPYPLHGVIWYQGESNVSRAWEYRQLFAAMIDDWRTRWERPLPFIWVQLANYKARNDQPAPSAWAELREAQNMTLSQDATAQAVAIDIGDAGDIHPRNKQEVGRRLALAALGLFCGRDIVYSGPQFKTMTIDGPTVTLEFDFVGGGLFDPNGENVEGFALAGEDRTFHWAQARIVAPDKVVLSCPQVPDPVAVRYGWADNPRVDLYNKEGLPASPFRTDDWPGRTQPTE